MGCEKKTSLDKPHNVGFLKGLNDNYTSLPRPWGGVHIEVRDSQTGAALKLKQTHSICLPEV